MPLGETIVALGSPIGESAIALIRLSGELCTDIAQEAFAKKVQPPARTVQVGFYRNIDGEKIDQCAFILYPDAKSYTGEPMLEINAHGNPLIAQKIMEDLVARGCRMAQAGEFTRTAFCNNKMDLAQAEAVSDLIRARSDKSLSVAQKQLAGHLGKKINEQMDLLLEVLAETEAYIDFPEENLPDENQAGPISKTAALIQDVSQLAETSHYGELLRDGIKTVILGAPNAGKSSLLNHLLGDNRAIVSPIAGTTRDFISERTMVGPYCIQLVDTAGLHRPGSDVEAIGIEKTIEKVQQSDFYLLIIEGQEEAPILPQEVLDCLTPKNTLLIVNKTDLPDQQDHTNFISTYPRVFISIKNGQGLTDLRGNIIETLEKDRVVPNEHQLIVSARHATALKAVKFSLEASLQKLKMGEPAELAASELRNALTHFGDILGKVDNEQMLDKLFSNFCIGK